MSGYAPARPRLELLEVLASISAFQDSKWKGAGARWGRAGAWCIVRQAEIIAWWARTMKRHGYPVTTMCRRTLNYHLASLQRGRYIAREQRHVTGRRTKKLELRPTLYKFTTLGRLWIKRRIAWVANPLDHLAVQNIAQSGFNNEVNSSTSLSRAVDKSAHSSGRKNRSARRRTSSSIAGKLPGKALSRSGPKSARGRARKAAAPRGGRGTARRRRRA